MAVLAILLSPIALLAASFVAQAQPPSKVPQIGFLGTDSLAGTANRLEAFRQGLRDLGYVEGRNIAIEYRWADGKVERFPDFAAELVRLKVDAIVATSTPGALAARNATGTTPIVFVTAADPIGSGLVASVARPGGNVTGLALLAPEITAKQLQLLKETVPKASRVAVLSNPSNAYTALLVKESEAAARSLAVRLQLLGVQGAAFDPAFSAVTRQRSDALLVLADPGFVSHRTRIVEFANQNRLPAMYPHREYAEAGGLMAYGADLRDNYRRAAIYVDKILKGAKTADLPVDQPTKLELVINLKTAKALGLTIPQGVLARSDQIIQWTSRDSCYIGLAASLYSGVELPAAADRALAMLARRPLGDTFGASWVTFDGDDGVSHENKVPEDPVGFLQGRGHRGQILGIYHVSMCLAGRFISRVVIPAAVNTYQLV